MLRVTFEIFPDEIPRRRQVGRVVRVIDIKEDGSGTSWYGNYKVRQANSVAAMPGSEGWRKKQVTNMPYKDFVYERLVYRALRSFLVDYDLNQVYKYRYTPSPEVAAQSDASVPILEVTNARTSRRRHRGLSLRSVSGERP